MTDDQIRCDTCAWFMNFGFVTQCNNEYVSDLMYFDIYPDASKCDQYRKRDYFEEYLIRAIDNLRKKMDKFPVHEGLTNQHCEKINAVIDTIMSILQTYQEFKEEEIQYEQMEGT